MIADWVPFVTAAAGFLGGMAARRTNQPKPPKPEKPICPCGHSVAYHERGAGVCQADEERDKYSVGGSWIGHLYVPCKCQNYAGPEVISSITMRPMAFGRVATDEPSIPGGNDAL